MSLQSANRSASPHLVTSFLLLSVPSLPLSRRWDDDLLMTLLATPCNAPPAPPASRDAHLSDLSRERVELSSSGFYWKLRPGRIKESHKDGNRRRRHGPAAAFACWIIDGERSSTFGNENKGRYWLMIVEAFFFLSSMFPHTTFFLCHANMSTLCHIRLPGIIEREKMGDTALGRHFAYHQSLTPPPLPKAPPRDKPSPAVSLTATS